MTTVFDISLKIAREVGDVIEGTATGGSTGTLVDSSLTTHTDDYFNGGTLWIKSGTHAGKVFLVTDYVSGGTASFATVTGAIVAGVRYAMTRGAYPFDKMVSAIQGALDDTYVEGHDYSLTGDGQMLDFSLPSGVYNVMRVESVTSDGVRTGSNHWKEVNGVLRFDYGYPPYADDTLHLYYKKAHDELTGYDTTISNEINLDWLRYRAAQELLWWGVGVYGSNIEYRIEERMNKIITELKTRRARTPINVMMHTGGIYS